MHNVRRLKLIKTDNNRCDKNKGSTHKNNWMNK